MSKKTAGQAISEAPQERLCHWWAVMNSFQWPPDLPGKPTDFEHLPDGNGPNRIHGEDRYSYVNPLMQQIAQRTKKTDRIEAWNQWIRDRKYRSEHDAEV